LRMLWTMGASSGWSCPSSSHRHCSRRRQASTRPSSSASAAGLVSRLSSFSFGSWRRALSASAVPLPTSFPAAPWPFQASRGL
jgi:hypothetical protein